MVRLNKKYLKIYIKKLLPFCYHFVIMLPFFAIY